MHDHLRVLTARGRGSVASLRVNVELGGPILGTKGLAKSHETQKKKKNLLIKIR